MRGANKVTKKSVFKIGEKVTVFRNGRVQKVGVKDRDRALNEYLVFPEKPGELEGFWVKPNQLRGANN